MSFLLFVTLLVDAPTCCVSAGLLCCCCCCCRIEGKSLERGLKLSAKKGKIVGTMACCCWGAAETEGLLVVIGLLPVGVLDTIGLIGLIGLTMGLIPEPRELKPTGSLMAGKLSMAGRAAMSFFAAMKAEVMLGRSMMPVGTAEVSTDA